MIADLFLKEVVPHFRGAVVYRFGRPCDLDGVSLKDIVDESREVMNLTGFGTLFAFTLAFSAF